MLSAFAPGSDGLRWLGEHAHMYVERDIDAKMVRTRRRPLPTGRLPPGGALWFGVVEEVLGLLILALRRARRPASGRRVRR